MKTIKIIDLLCYISISDYDKIPKKVKWRDDVWEYDDRMQDYTNGHLMLFEQLKIIKTKEFLNDEVEILDEEDEFEDIEEIYFSVYEQERLEETVLDKIEERVNQLIKNQKKIIERLNNQDNN